MGMSNSVFVLTKLLHICYQSTWQKQFLYSYQTDSQGVSPVLMAAEENPQSCFLSQY